MVLLPRRGNYITIRNRKQFRELSSPFILLAVAWSGTCRSQLRSEWRIMEASKDISSAGLSSPSSFTPGLHNVRWFSCLQVFSSLQVCSHNPSRTGAQVLVLLSQKGPFWGKELHGCWWPCCQRRCKTEAEASLRVFTGSNGLPKSSHAFGAECLILREKEGGNCLCFKCNLPS